MVYKFIINTKLMKTTYRYYHNNTSIYILYKQKWDVNHGITKKKKKTLQYNKY